MQKFDMHIHTTSGSSDARMTIEQAALSAKGKGLDGICITEHNKYIPANQIKDIAHKTGITILNGMEMSLSYGHFLVYMPDDRSMDELLHREQKIKKEEIILFLEGIKNELSAEDGETVSRTDFSDMKSTRAFAQFFQDHIDPYCWLTDVHELGGVVYWAHPFDDHSKLRDAFNTYVEEIQDLDIANFWQSMPEKFPDLYKFITSIDGFETKNGFTNIKGVNNFLAHKFAQITNKSGISGSDAHTIERVGTSVTIIDTEISDNYQLVNGLRNHRYY